MFKKTVFLVIAMLSCFTATAFAAEKETIVTRPWGGEKELKGLGVKKFASTSTKLELIPGKTYRFQCNMTKTPPMSKHKYNHRMVLFGIKNKKNTQLLRIGTDIPADSEPHAINEVFTIPADTSAPFSLSLYNANCTGIILVEDFVITEVKK
jgi:hypothetical protein